VISGAGGGKIASQQQGHPQITQIDADGGREKVASIAA
jgi:hypothetical protein